jgi:hypothetical protein
LDAKFAKLQHAQAGNLFGTWQSVAGDLLAAAQVLRERRDSWNIASLTNTDPIPPIIMPVELMLIGMAIECLLKAVWIKRGNDIVKNGTYVGVPGAADHDLLQLASAIKCSLDDREKHVLLRLSHFIQYGGRYPIPKRSDHLRLKRSPCGGKGAATTWKTPSDYRLVDVIVARLEALH